MASERPKLLVVGDTPGIGALLVSRLSDTFDVEAAQSDAPGDSGGYDAIISAAGADHPAQEDSARLLDAIGEGVGLAEPDGRLVWCNRFLRDLPQGAREQIAACCTDAARHFAAVPGPVPGSRSKPGASCVLHPTCKFEISTPVDPDADDADGAGALDAGADTPARRAESVHHELFVTQVDPGTPDAGRLAVVVRDVTQARNFTRKMDAVDRAGYELICIDADAVREKNAMERLGLLETKIVDIAHELLLFDHFVIYLLDEQSGRLEQVVSHGLPEEIQDFKLYRSDEGSGISGYVATTGKSYLCHNADEDDRYLPGLEGARSSLTVPLMLTDQVIGIMDIESQTEHAFNEEDRQFAEIFARHVAVALHMLDLLVAERCTTNETVSGRIEHELAEPLEDITEVIEALRPLADRDPAAAALLERISTDVTAIRGRVRDVTSGPQTLLGVDRALAEREHDPIIEGRRILVVDDELRVRKVIGDVLSSRGAEATIVSTGAEAIERLQAGHPIDGTPYEMVVSDIKLPDANGYEIFRAARKQSPGTAVILMTGFGYDPHHSIVRASQEGLQRVLFKPFEVKQLLDEVRSALTKQDAAASGTETGDGAEPDQG